MVKKSLSSLLPELEKPAPSEAPVPVPVEATASAESETPAPAKPKRRASSPTHQHFSTMDRKETRLREDQWDAIAALTKRIKRAKTPGGERITDNTLIRVAIDLLLENADKLQGSTEAELRNSVINE